MIAVVALADPAKEPDPMPPRDTKTQRVIDDLARRIAVGEYPPGSRLPSRSQLAREYGVSEQVARNATMRLQVDGLVESVERGGIYVKRPTG